MEREHVMMKKKNEKQKYQIPFMEVEEICDDVIRTSSYNGLDIENQNDPNQDISDWGSIFK